MPLEHAPPRQRSKLYIALWAILPASLLMLISTSFAGYGIYRFVGNIDDENRAIFPGEIAVTLPAGDYNIWLYTYAIEDGNAYESDGQLPASLTLTLEDAAANSILLKKSTGNYTKSMMEESAIVVRNFEITEAGDYTLYSHGEAKPLVLEGV